MPRVFSSAFIRVHPRFRSLVRLAGVIVVGLIVIGLVGQVVRDRFFVAHLMMHAPLVLLGAGAMVLGIVWRRSRAWRATLILSGIVAIVSGAVPMIGGGPSSTPTPVGHAVTIVQWNVRWGGGGAGVDGSVDRWSAICDELAGVAPDIIILSEAPSPPRIAELSGRLGGDWSMAQVRSAPRARYLYSLAVLSRWPVMLERESTIPSGRTMLARVLAPGGDVRVLVVDGQSTPLIRRTQRLRAVSDICRAANKSGAPVHIVAGDFNAIGRSIGFDAIRDAGYAPASASSGGWRGTWPAICPVYDIDHVWLSDGVTVTHCELFSNRVTDHRGTVARVRLPAQWPATMSLDHAAAAPDSPPHSGQCCGLARRS
jgi:endonuclease/exonuclease/phosphatase family metal-dependent hydrolase